MFHKETKLVYYYASLLIRPSAAIWIIWSVEHLNRLRLKQFMYLMVRIKKLLIIWSNKSSSLPWDPTDFIGFYCRSVLGNLLEIPTSINLVPVSLSFHQLGTSRRLVMQELDSNRNSCGPMKLCDLIELDVPSKAFNYVLTISRIVIALGEGTACISQIVISTHTPNHYLWLGLEYDSILNYYQICLHLHPTLHQSVCSSNHWAA